MGDIIHNISRVDQAVCWPDFTAPYSTKPSAELSSCFRLTLSCCSTTSTVDEVQRYARYAIKLVIYALVHVMLSYLDLLASGLHIYARAQVTCIGVVPGRPSVFREGVVTRG